MRFPIMFFKRVLRVRGDAAGALRDIQQLTLHSSASAQSEVQDVPIASSAGTREVRDTTPAKGES